jgi:mannose-6-phosphate isomerase-like protein (cupin superfamily)
MLPAMSFTHKRLNEVPDQAPGFGMGEIQEARFATESLSAETTGLAYHVLRPGKRQGFAHKHENAEEIYVILAGSGRLKLDDEIIDVGTMDAIRVAPTVVRAFEAGDDGLEYLAFGPRHEGDGEIIRNGFWND